MKRVIKQIIQESREKPENWIPYLMLTILFGLALLLPAYAVKYQAKQSSVQSIEQQDQDTIVIDPGHGGCQLRK